MILSFYDPFFGRGDETVIIFIVRSYKNGCTAGQSNAMKLHWLLCSSLYHLSRSGVIFYLQAEEYQGAEAAQERTCQIRNTF